MLGAIIGDMVGSPYEFHPWQGAAEAFPLFSPRSRFTDDTVMTVAVARGLMQAYGQEQACREAFIDAMHEALGEGSIIAEDLGYLTPEVKAMLAESGYPGMKIMQFAFDSREPGNYLPHTYPRNSVVYTGTHDNITTEGWCREASDKDIAYACRYLRCTPDNLTEGMICACLASVSDTAIIPLADWLHLGSEARINTPSTQGANWHWRLTQSLPAALAGHIAALTTLYERVPKAL